MAKRNLFLGTASGKIGDIVVYRAGGTQRSRVRVTPKDARTTAQMEQRSRLGNVVVHYRAGKGIFEDSFENKPSKQTSYNAFAEGALPNAPYLVKALNDAGLCVPQNFAVSRGSIPNPFSAVNANDGSGEATIDGEFTGEFTTVAAISDALMDARPCCFRNGSVIVAVAFEYTAETIDGIQGYRLLMKTTKLKIDNTDTSSLSSATAMTFLGSRSNLTIGYALDAEKPAGFAFLVVNTDSDGIHVTSADVTLNTAAQAAYTAKMNAEAKEAAAISYNASGSSCVL